MAFTTVSSVRLCTAEYLISLSDTDTNRKHLPIANIANRESIHTLEGELNSVIHIAWQVHMCTPNKLFLFPFNIQTSQRSTTSLSPHLLGCLVGDLNYGPWTVTAFTLSCALQAWCLVKHRDNFTSQLLPALRSGPSLHIILLYVFCRLSQCFSNFVRPRPGKFFFHKTRARSQQIYS